MRNLKIVLLGSVFMLGAASAASAADVYAPGTGSLKDEPIAYAPPITWAGPYIGGHIGSTFESEFDFEQGGSVELDDALNAGAHIGYNWQTPSNWVYGVEADLGIVDDDFEGADVTDYVATLRGRLGYAFGSSLIYGTGGAAWVGYDDSAIDDTAFGFAVGGGWEHKLTSNFSLGVESLYYDVSGDDEDFGVDDFDQDFWTVRARVTYHFGSRYEEALK